MISIRKNLMDINTRTTFMDHLHVFALPFGVLALVKQVNERWVRINDKFLTRARLCRSGNTHGSWTHPGQLPSRAACTM